MLRPGKDKGLATPIPLGLAGLATSTFVMGAAMFVRSPDTLGPYLTQALMFGCVVEILAGMWAFAYGDPIAATSFTFLGAFFGWWALSQMTVLGVHAASAAAVRSMALVFLVSGVVIFYLWVASFYEFAAFNLALLFFWICCALAGIGMFAGSQVTIGLGGISAICSALISAYASFAEAYNAASLQDLVPVGESKAVRQRIEQDENQRILRLHANEPHIAA